MAATPRSAISLPTITSIQGADAHYTMVMTGSRTALQIPGPGGSGPSGYITHLSCIVPRTHAGAAPAAHPGILDFSSQSTLVTVSPYLLALVFGSTGQTRWWLHTLFQHLGLG
jgi:hypothetical protein